MSAALLWSGVAASVCRRGAFANGLRAVPTHKSRIEVAPYDPAWPGAFEAEAARLDRTADVSQEASR
jgi:GrpB-like predicted nucleotidyltransferase (UPF0157 family)